MGSDHELYLAEFDTPDTQTRGVGETPEEAVESLLSAFRKGVRTEGVDKSLPVEYREDIKVVALQAGKGFFLGAGSAHWHDDTISGDDARFDDVIRAYESSVDAAPQRRR